MRYEIPGINKPRTYLSNLPVIPLGSLRKENFVLCQLLFIWEGDTVYPLQRFIVGISEEV